MNPWGGKAMIVTTIPSAKGKNIAAYHGVVVGKTIVDVELDHEVINSMLMVSDSGTAA